MECLKKLNLTDWLLVAGVLSLIGFTGYNLYIKFVFDPSSFGEGLMMLLFGHGAHKAGNSYVDSLGDK